MELCKWCGEDVAQDGIGDFCSENCLLNMTDDPRITPEERKQLQALHDEWLDADIK